MDDIIIRSFEPKDMFRLSKVNLDKVTINFSYGFYMNFIGIHNVCAKVAVDENDVIVGYILGTIDVVDDKNSTYIGHISALSIIPKFRGTGLAHKLMQIFEDIAYENKVAYVDLFVKCTNTIAIKFYKNRGYVVYNELQNYYGIGDHGFTMRFYRDAKTSIEK